MATQLKPPKPLPRKKSSEFSEKAKQKKDSFQKEARRRSRSLGGYDCEYIEQPPQYLQSECPICLMVLRDPHQVSCCGNSFCRVCIDVVQTSSSPCPTCNNDSFSVFQDKRLQRSLYAFHVRCPHAKEGCQWTGELGELGKHLNESPGKGDELVGCEFVEVECIYCMEPFQRCSVSDHQVRDCNQRPFSCDFCGYQSIYEEVVRKHWPVCGYCPVPCPNDCGVYPERQNLEHHVAKDCSLTVVNCDFHYAGCEVQLPRKDMPAHLVEGLVVHLPLIAAYNERKLAERDQLIAKFKEELEQSRRKVEKMEKEKRQEIASLKAQYEEHSRSIAKLIAKQEKDRSSLDTLHSYAGIFPVQLTMTDVRKHMTDDDTWFSKPFYTHPHGYKMCLKVAVNSTPVSVYIYLMRGEFDDHLRWPFQGQVTVQLINQAAEDEGHYTSTISFSNLRQSGIGRVVDVERAVNWFGQAKFFPLEELRGYSAEENCQYLKDDCLHFKIMRVTDVNRAVQLERQWLEIESRVCTPPIEFTMSDADQQKKENATWYSPSFYTRQRGYKMSLHVSPNGIAAAKGTHVSVYMCLVRGEFDEYLKWPFRGDITVQLLNQREDKNHHEMTIRFTDITPHDIAGRVTIGMRANPLRNTFFISHDMLGYNRNKNCQYLNGDCLHFRVAKVKTKM